MTHTEQQTIEWKREWKDDCLKWICGYANTEGGRLVLSKDDSGTAVGLKDAEKLLEDLLNKIRDLLGIIVGVNLHHAPTTPSPIPPFNDSDAFRTNGCPHREVTMPSVIETKDNFRQDDDHA